MERKRFVLVDVGNEQRRKNAPLLWGLRASRCVMVLIGVLGVQFSRSFEVVNWILSVTPDTRANADK